MSHFNNIEWLLAQFYIIFIFMNLISLIQIVKCENLNLPPYFIPGSGDMARFSLSENSPVGSPVYQLKGLDPEGSRIHYSISGPVFSVDRNTGVVRLRQELDRETQNLVEVIISITDEGISGTEPNTISLRREIPIRDYNDNAPTFIGRPYMAKVSESTILGSIIDIRPPIVVIDRDEGVNAEIQLSCFENDSSDNVVCESFHVSADKIEDGNYTANIVLLKQLDYEARSSYILTIMAKDMARENSLTSFATVTIEVLDVQDQPPIFMNAPYSTTIAENTPEGTTILNITAMDGDTGSPRELLLTLENEIMGHFKLEPIGEPGDGKVALITTDIPLDRESLEILQKGGVYTFNIRATELIDKEPTSDSATTQITIVVTDTDDHTPEFNQPSFNISIPENLGKGMPLPGLSLFANDRDLGVNSRYQLLLRNVQNAENVFEVSPTESEGRTPVVVKVLNPEKLDYDVEDETLRVFVFDIIASVNDTELAISRITVTLSDTNDNSPIFEQSAYHFKVEENLMPDTKIGDIIASDRDSDKYGTIKYILKGFGSDFFYTNETTGGLYTKKSLDYEKQTSYSLSIVAIDGGHRETNANLLIDVIDLNDNSPIFESQEYTRTVREGATNFEPQFFVRAIDIDGPSQGGGNISYSIKAENSISGQVFGINENTGEITFRRVAKSMDTEKGQYELLVVANDHGIPPLQNTTKVYVRVGISGNQRPIFKGHFRNTENLPVVGPPSYRVSIPENAKPNDNVTIVAAQDPDGIDSLLKYSIVGANDNFIIDEISGLIRVSSQAHFDRDTIAKDYQIIVNAIDAGFPIPETATTTVYVNINDVNNKPPKFDQYSYVAYVSERTEIGVEILKVTATDPDLNAKLEYQINEPLRATTKAGVTISSGSNYNLQESFRIDKMTGQIFVNGSLRHDIAAVVTLKVKVKDLNAEINIEKQFAIAEVTIYVQSFKDTNPIFKNKGWKSTNPVVSVTVKEEMPIDSTLFILEADDPVNNQPIFSYEMIEKDESGYFSLHDRTGEILLKKRLDYESLDKNNFGFLVKANTKDGQRSTVTKVNITVENVNDNSPIFDQTEYHATLIEDKKYPEKVITIKATDKDAALTDLDDKIGFHKISYSLHGENSNLFEINNSTGEIIIAKNQIVDREKNSKIRLSVKAEDSPGRPTEAKQALVELLIDVLDVNDNMPSFLQQNYTAVIPENAQIDSFVLNVTALDPDEGPGGEVRYDIVNEGEVYGLLKINRLTGEIRTKRALTGKGRSDSYEIIIRAQDNGGQVQKQESLYSDVSAFIYIGDVSANDGIPYFIAPEIGQIANISENATIGSPVFQVIAEDPDSPNTPSGNLFYKIQDDNPDAENFQIDSITGLITTTATLDREAKDIYNIILEVTDNGQPRQSATRILRIQVLDIDDHQPRFVRDIDSQPIEMIILEEEPAGTVVGNITALDEDISENGDIDYMFIDGNHEGLFEIKRTNENIGIITTTKKLDRENYESYRLTVKCFKNGIKQNEIPRSEYNRFDMSEIEILVKIKDIDDNLPIFDEKDPAIGIRINVPIDTVVATVKATDKDPDALPIIYSINNITFIPQFYKRKTQMTDSLKDLFIINNRTAEIRTGGNFFDFVDGYFNIKIKANNSQKTRRHTLNTLKIYVIRDISLLKFIFVKPPSEIQNVITDFEHKLQKQLRAMNLEIHVYDTQVLIKPDMSLDFSAASSCFQLFRNGSALPLSVMQKLMDSEQMKQDLLDTYVEFGVSNIESCAVKRKLIASSLMYSAGTWLVILAGLIGIAAIAATCTAFCLARKYKIESKQQSQASSSRTTHEPFGSSSHSIPIYYSEPIYGPL